MSSIPFDRSGIGMSPIDTAPSKIVYTTPETSPGSSFEDHLKREAESSESRTVKDTPQRVESENQTESENDHPTNDNESGESRQKPQDSSNSEKELSQQDAEAAESNNNQSDNDSEEKDSENIANAEQAIAEKTNEELELISAVDEQVAIDQETDANSVDVETPENEHNNNEESKTKSEQQILEAELESEIERDNEVKDTSLESAANSEINKVEKVNELTEKTEDYSPQSKKTLELTPEELVLQNVVKEATSHEDSEETKASLETAATKLPTEGEEIFVDQEPRRQENKKRKSSQPQALHVRQKKDASGTKEPNIKENMILKPTNQGEETEGRQSIGQNLESGSNTTVKNEIADENSPNTVRLPEHLMARGQQRAESGLRLTNAEQVRFVQRVARAFQVAQGRDGQIRLRLSPPELGSMQLEVRVQEGVLTARIETETAAARSVLLDNLGGLKDRLAEMNIKVEQFDVDMMDRQSGEQTGGALDERKPDERSDQNMGNLSSESDETTTEENQEESNPLGQEGQLDVVI